MFFLSSIKKPHLIGSLSFISVICSLNANAESLQTTKLSVLSLDMEREVAVSHLNDDEWDIKEGRDYILGNKSKDGDTLTIRADFSDVSENRKAITQIYYKRVYQSSAVDMKEMENALVERYGTPVDIDKYSDYMILNFSDSGKHIPSTEVDLFPLIMECAELSKTQGGGFSLNGASIAEEHCSPSVVSKYVDAMDRYHSPRMHVSAFKNKLERRLSWSFPNMEYLHSQNIKKKQEELNKPNATLD